MPGQGRVQRGRLGDAAMQQGVEVRAVELVEAVVLGQVGLDLGTVGTADQPLVQALQRQLTRTAAGGRALRLAGSLLGRR